MNYNEARQWIHSRLAFGIRPGIDRMNWVLEKLNNPERRVKFVHVGGTNGKGSTITYMRSVLQEAGYVVGTFTSPYVITFNERISVNGEPISDEEWAELVSIVKPVAEELDETDLGSLTEFESITVMALYYFAKINPVDVVLLEVGLGGRFDSTNVIAPLLSVITNVGYDHMNILGNTLEEIAYEKAGIIKSGIPAVTGIQDANILRIFDEEAKGKRTKVYALQRDFFTEEYERTEHGESFRFMSSFTDWDTYEITMKGAHQCDNAAVACMALDLLRTYFAFLIDPEHVHAGLKKAMWQGRMETVRSSSPRIVIDGAHNVEGARALAETVKSHFNNVEVDILAAMVGNKEHGEVISYFDDVADRIAFANFDFPKAMKGEELFALSRHEKKETVENWQQWLQDYIEAGDDSRMLLVTGSLYFISQVREFLTK